MIFLCLPLSTSANHRQAGKHVQDIIFFGNKGPVLLRLQVEVNGVPARNILRNYIQKWVAFADRDGDGVLDAKEVQNLPNAQAMTQMVRNGYFLIIGNQGSLSMNGLGRDDDAKVDADDLLDYYLRNGFNPFQIAPNNAIGTMQNALSEALFKQLDTDGDGKLSEAELSAGWARLQMLDLDDDELISQQELSPTAVVQNFRGGVVVPRPGGFGGPASGIPSAFYVVDASKSPAQMTAQVLAKYDKNNDNKLSLEESGLDAQTFSRLDINRDRYLSVTELMLFLRTLRAVPVVVRLGDMKDNEAAVSTSEDLASQAGAKVLKTSRDDVHLMVGDAKVSVHRHDGNPAMMNNPATRIYMQMFRMANPANKPFLEMKDVENPRYRVLQMIFSIADKNGDGKLTESEVEELANLVGEARDSIISLRISEEGRALFQLMDADRDGKLSQRELMSAWANLAALDHDGDGKLSLDELARQYVIEVYRGSVQFAGRPLGQQQPGAAPMVRRSGRGPAWFQRMDINSDGDVSLREFLGSREMFEQIDTNGDGLISVEEAEAADKTARK